MARFCFIIAIFCSYIAIYGYILAYYCVLYSCHMRLNIAISWHYAICRWPLTITHCFEIMDSCHFCNRLLGFFVRPNLSFWHSWCLHFGVLGDSGTILGHCRAGERTLWSPGLDLDWFLVSVGTPFWELVGYIGPRKLYFFTLVSRFRFPVMCGSESGFLGFENQAFG